MSVRRWGARPGHGLVGWLLVLVLPLQLSFAVAGACCGHAQDGAAHFGHHEHRAVPDDGGGVPDSGCGHCQLSVVKFLCTSSVAAASAPGVRPLPAPVQDYRSAVLDLPERPPAGP